MPTRRRLATGIYEDAYGRAVVFHVHGVRQPEQRFPIDTPLERLIRWRATQIAQATELVPRDPRGSLARDIIVFLRRLKGTPSYKSEKAHLRAWLRVLPAGIRRWQITRELVELTLAGWRAQGYAVNTIRHRCRLLESLYHRLDGRRAATPLDDVPIPPKPKARPVSVADSLIVEVATNLRKSEIATRLRSAQTRARFLVLAAHEQRPSEVKRAQRPDVDLDRRLWFVRGGKGGLQTIVPLNDEQLEAWRLFAHADAWGWFDSRSFVRTLQQHGWPRGIRPYNLRHSTGFALSARGVDLGDIQALFGHTSPTTTRIYVPAQQLERLRLAHAKLDGRFGALPFVPPAGRLPRSTPTIGRGRDAKGRDFTRKTRRA